MWKHVPSLPHWQINLRFAPYLAVTLVPSLAVCVLIIFFPYLAACYAPSKGGTNSF